MQELVVWKRTRLHQSPSLEAQPSPAHPPNKSRCHQSPQLARPCASATAVPFALAAPHWPHPALAIGAWLVRTAAATNQGDNVSCPLTPRIFLCLASPEPRRFTDDPKGSASAVPARKGEQSKPSSRGEGARAKLTNNLSLATTMQTRATPPPPAAAGSTTTSPQNARQRAAMQPWLALTPTAKLLVKGGRRPHTHSAHSHSHRPSPPPFQQHAWSRNSISRAPAASHGPIDDAAQQPLPQLHWWQQRQQRLWWRRIRWRCWCWCWLPCSAPEQRQRRHQSAQHQLYLLE